MAPFRLWAALIGTALLPAAFAPSPEPLWNAMHDAAAEAEPAVSGHFAPAMSAGEHDPRWYGGLPAGYEQTGANYQRYGHDYGHDHGYGGGFYASPHPNEGQGLGNIRWSPERSNFDWSVQPPPSSPGSVPDLDGHYGLPSPAPMTEPVSPRDPWSHQHVGGSGDEDDQTPELKSAWDNFVASRGAANIFSAEAVRRLPRIALWNDARVSLQKVWASPEQNELVLDVVKAWYRSWKIGHSNLEEELRGITPMQMSWSNDKLLAAYNRYQHVLEIDADMAWQVLSAPKLFFFDPSREYRIVLAGPNSIGKGRRGHAFRAVALPRDRSLPAIFFHLIQVPASLLD
ncbi:uncharacterized protein PFL1_02632 [Pseudozyma flocculosa PF-1]|uniref:Uncharacterized protein n=1 Tax=Pseudozyma flocculosa PF-1 TaxID=1277687 RepID=A0A061HD41_9BASI|nr:uncharacterized protein PFL1_02632 [Pseudozyma flocculosa PF-1]EPQ29960.1 hypothetical protein PFL1_02632 [Pseudozyma flocculosa PF-1]